jgi:glycerol-3-phosphate dehydrogenase
MRPLDVLVVGGGITGAGVARLAARNGLDVALVERGDLASGASSGTSHLLHGGLRYLEHGQFRLVREALSERAAVTRLAPELAHPTRFMVPFRRGDRRPPWMVRIGLGLYDAFAGRANLAPHTTVGRREAMALEPDLAEQDLVGAGLYSDAVMDDARLAIAVARDAAAHGAAIHTYTEATGARPAERDAIEVLTRDALDGTERRFVARAIVNASGAWADQLRTRFSRSLTPGAPDPAPLLRPSRGMHLVFPALTRGHGLLLFAPADDRVFFAVPFAGHTLVGTTEVEVASPIEPEALAPDPEEVRYLRAALAGALPAKATSPVLAVMSGVRPLLAAAGEVGGASREHRVFQDGALFTVAGGKYTTFRVMARDAVVAVCRKQHPGRHVVDLTEPLPRPLGDGHPVETLADFAVEHEFARRIEDVVRRRTHLWLTPDRGRVVAPAIGGTLARRLGWSPERLRDELSAFHAGLDDEERLLMRARETR